MKILEPDILALLVGDFNVMPTALGVYKPKRWTAGDCFDRGIKHRVHELGHLDVWLQTN